MTNAQKRKACNLNHRPIDKTKNEDVQHENEESKFVENKRLDANYDENYAEFDSEEEMLMKKFSFISFSKSFIILKSLT